MLKEAQEDGVRLRRLSLIISYLVLYFIDLEKVEAREKRKKQMWISYSNTWNTLKSQNLLPYIIDGVALVWLLLC